MSTSQARAPQSQRQDPIATGGYGCVYRPAITCDGVPTPRLANKLVGSVSKLQAVSRTSNNEIRIGEMVAGLPNSAEYFITPESTCTVAPMRFPPTIADGCKPVAEIGPTELVVMRMRDVPHRKLGASPRKSTPDSVRNTLRNIVIGLPHCFQALVLLQAAENTGNPIVHFDLKADNIFAPDLPRLPLIADFGISFLPLEMKFEDAADMTIAFEPGYYVWPPEIHLLAYLLHAKRPQGAPAAATPKELEGIAARVAASNPMLASRPDAIEQRTAEVQRFYESLSPATAESVFEYTMDHWDKIDLYSLCMCFGAILQAYELGEEGEYLRPVMALLQQGTAADPEQRPLLGRVLAVSRRLVGGGDRATIVGLTTVREVGMRNRDRAMVSLHGADRRLGRTTARLESSLRAQASA